MAHAGWREAIAAMNQFQDRALRQVAEMERTGDVAMERLVGQVIFQTAATNALLLGIGDMMEAMLEDRDGTRTP